MLSGDGDFMLKMHRSRFAGLSEGRIDELTAAPNVASVRDVFDDPPRRARTGRANRSGRPGRGAE